MVLLRAGHVVEFWHRRLIRMGVDEIGKAEFAKVTGEISRSSIYIDTETIRTLVNPDDVIFDPDITHGDNRRCTGSSDFGKLHDVSQSFKSG